LILNGKETQEKEREKNEIKLTILLDLVAIE
jgi:hypothetical protein